VPNADTWESSAADSLFNWFCCPAPNALVSEDTMALILSPEPMPVDVTSEPPATPAVAPLDAEELLAAGVVVVGAVVLEMVELMAVLVPFQLPGLSTCRRETEARDVPIVKRPGV
jgi:hypothetical protein